MSIITKEDIIKIAQMSNIQIHEHEIEPLQRQLETVLAYASRVQEVAATHEYERKNVNVMRDDEVVAFNSDSIVACAPESEAHLFVVPAILENK